MAESPRRMHRGIAALIVIVLFLAVCYAAISMLAPAPAVAATPYSDLQGEGDAGEPMSLPSGPGAAGVAIVGIDDAVDSAGDPEPLPMASIVKLLTALVVLEEQPMDEGSEGAEIVMTSDDIGYYWDVAAVAGVVTDLREGQALTQRQLLERSIVVSSGNATLSLTRWAFGDQDAFLDAAADWVARHSLESVHVADPSGLQADTVASAADMARIGRIAYGSPVVREIMAQERVEVMGETFLNTNPLLGEDGIHGGKTGTLFASGSSLLVVAERDVHGTPITVVSVVVGIPGSTSTAAASNSWLRQIFDRFTERVVLPAGSAVGEYRAPWSESPVTVSTAEDLSAIAWPGVPVSVSVQLDEVDAGALLAWPGEASVSSFGSEHAVEVTLDGMVAPPDALWRLANPQLAVSWILDLAGAS